MEGKVLLYDSNDVKIGETYLRRARQLVKQQRASWVDDSQKAVRFAPGMENMDDAVDGDMSEGHARLDPGAIADKELMKFAKRRVYARFAFRLHVMIFIILTAFFLMIFMFAGGGYFWPVWPILSIGLSVAVHGTVYKTVFGDNMSDKIAREYEQLKYRHSWVDHEDKRS